MSYSTGTGETTLGPFGGQVNVGGPTGVVAPPGPAPIIAGLTSQQRRPAGTSAIRLRSAMTWLNAQRRDDDRAVVGTAITIVDISTRSIRAYALGALRACRSQHSDPERSDRVNGKRVWVRRNGILWA